MELILAEALRLAASRPGKKDCLRNILQDFIGGNSGEYGLMLYHYETPKKHAIKELRRLTGSSYKKANKYIEALDNGIEVMLPDYVSSFNWEDNPHLWIKRVFIPSSVDDSSVKIKNVEVIFPSR